MFVLAHIGIGKTLLSPAFPFWAVAIGALLPDLIDKPLYYLFANDLIVGTRTFAHLLWPWLILLIGNRLWPRPCPAIDALAWAALSHLLLDLIGSVLSGRSIMPQIIGFLFPLLGWQFPQYPFLDLHDHLHQTLTWEILAGEAIGAFLLWKGYKKSYGKPKGNFFGPRRHSQ